MGTVTTPSPRRSVIAQWLYGSLFVLVLPLALVWWAHATGAVVHVPALHDPWRGAVVTAAGLIIILLGIAALWSRGGGLPMNAFPPPRFVAGGIYALVPHPIYGGFILACAGVSVFTGSASGLWLVTPAVALGCAALVLGYELPDLRRRFGPPGSSPWLPLLRAGAPTLLERWRIYFVVLLPWFAGYELIGHLGPPPESVSTWLPFEARLPIIEALEPIYASVYLAVLLAPLLIRSAGALRLFAMRGLTAIAFIFPLYLLLPFYVPPRPFHPSTIFAPLMLIERSPISGVAAFPSFHIVWACIAASALGEGAAGSGSLPGYGPSWLRSVAPPPACTPLPTSSPDLPPTPWSRTCLRSGRPCFVTSERLANSWKEWRIGAVRIINHGAYAGAGAAVGILIIDTLIGPGHAALSLGICLCSLLGAALWAQWVEGSPALLRPLGFYGGVLGAIAGCSVAFALHMHLWTALAAAAMAAPWIQAIGRLRCLVQGCCHGHAAESVPGIRYTHPRSRVCRLAHLAGVPVHATPLYSILCNVLIGAALFRLYQIHVPAAFLLGIYLFLSGAGRFVEEAYRGEPQTRIVAGLRFYQWTAMVSVIGGAAITCVPRSPLLLPFALRPGSVVLALACGALTWFITGVDFPESNRRFARLT